MRGKRLQLTTQQAKDLMLILGYSLAVPKAINTKIKAWGGEGFARSESERLSNSMDDLWIKVSRLQ